MQINAMAPSLTQFAYQTLQQSKSLAGLAHKELSARLMEILASDVIPQTEPIPVSMMQALRHSMAKLGSIDWQEAEEGLYPTSLLFDAPWLDWARRYPLIWLDLPSNWQRRRARNVRDLPDYADPQAYPDYYLQNFHHQTDGYLSDRSASLYDLQVEILFNGTADAMRRRVIGPIARGLRRFAGRPGASLRLLDVATGTGRTLHQIGAALPEINLIGLDLSAAYLRQASRWMNERDTALAQLVRGNAEDLPFNKASMQAVSCVFLLHELPGDARQVVLDECWRVLEPGGIIVLADSVQLADAPEFRTVMENFRRFFHEPYYRDYISDDIDARLRHSGFEDITAGSYFMTRVWSAIKPAEPLAI